MKSLGGKLKVELDLSNYALKTDLKKCNRHWYIYRLFAKKFNLANLKSNVDRLDIDKLKNVLFEVISKLK